MKIICPLGDRLAVKIHEALGVSKFGIIIPDQAKEKQQIGTVVAVGPGKPLQSGIVFPIPVEVGATVIVSKYGGAEIVVEGEKLLMLGVDDILAEVREGDANSNHN